VLDKKNEAYWQWEGKETLIRIHKTPRRQNFVPQDCEDCPCDPRIICDERETEQKFKTNTRVIRDTWRFKGDNHESTNLGFPPVLARSGSDIDPMCAAIFINIVALLFF
jgi:hypothetical protein